MKPDSASEMFWDRISQIVTLGGKSRNELSVHDRCFRCLGSIPCRLRLLALGSSGKQHETLLTQPLGTGLNTQGCQHCRTAALFRNHHLCFYREHVFSKFYGKSTVTQLLGHYFLKIRELPHLLHLHGVSPEKLLFGSQVTPLG